MVGVRLSVVVEARQLARAVLSDRPERWQHTVEVARRARSLGPHEDVLEAAAWLHDIGYGEATVRTGFHPLDGADFLDRHGWPERLSALVAHHSGARFVADELGLGGPMGRFPFELSPVSDALTYADQTVGPYGRRLSLDERL